MEKRIVIDSEWELSEIWRDALEQFEGYYDANHDFDAFQLVNRSYNSVKKESAVVRPLYFTLESFGRLRSNSHEKKLHDLAKKIEANMKKLKDLRLDYESEKDELLQITSLLESLNIPEKDVKAIKKAWFSDNSKYFKGFNSVSDSLHSMIEKKQNELKVIGSCIDYNCRRRAYSDTSKVEDAYKAKASISLPYLVADLWNYSSDCYGDFCENFSILRLREGKYKDLEELIDGYNRSINTISDIRDIIRKREKKYGAFLIETNKTLVRIEKSLKEELKRLESKRIKLDTMKEKTKTEKGDYKPSRLIGTSDEAKKGFFETFDKKYSSVGFIDNELLSHVENEGFNTYVDAEGVVHEVYGYYYGKKYNTLKRAMIELKSKKNSLSLEEFKERVDKLIELAKEFGLSARSFARIYYEVFKEKIDVSDNEFEMEFHKYYGAMRFARKYGKSCDGYLKKIEKMREEDSDRVDSLEDDVRRIGMRKYTELCILWYRYVVNPKSISADETREFPDVKKQMMEVVVEYDLSDEDMRMCETESKYYVAKSMADSSKIDRLIEMEISKEESQDTSRNSK